MYWYRLQEMFENRKCSTYVIYWTLVAENGATKVALQELLMQAERTYNRMFKLTDGMKLNKPNNLKGIKGILSYSKEMGPYLT